MTDPCAPLLPLNKDSHQYTAFNLLSAESNITYINQTHKEYMQMQQLCESKPEIKTALLIYSLCKVYWKANEKLLENLRILLESQESS